MLYSYLDKYGYILGEETRYKTDRVPVIDGWDWNMYEHIRLTTLYKNSKYSTGKFGDRPFMNIMRPMLNLQYRAEGFDVKDIGLFVDDPKNYYKSFILRKWYQNWARDVGLDTFIDEVVESFVDFGGALIKKAKDVRPEVVPLQRLAFCDQTDMLSGPLAEKHYYSPSQLKAMEKYGWKNIDEVIALADEKKKNDNSGREAKTPGRYIEVFETHGEFPDWWLKDEPNFTGKEELIPQLHICTFYTNQKDEKKGITLFKGKEPKSIYKALKRDPIYGRALGYGGAEELFEPQVWTNYDIQRIKGMLDQASKIIYQTADPTFANRNKTGNLDNGEILIHADGQQLSQINNSPVNISVFERSMVEWTESAKMTAAASDPILGAEPKAGTPARLVENILAEGHSLHEYRKGKIARFIDEVHKDWIIPELVKTANSGKQFLSELDADELISIADSFVTNKANEKMKELVLSGKNPKKEDIEAFKEQVRADFMKSPKKFLEIFKGELEKAPIQVKTNIAGKQKYLGVIAEKLMGVLRDVIAAPQILQNPSTARIFNQILESSGLSPVDFHGFKVATQEMGQNAIQQPAQTR